VAFSTDFMMRIVAAAAISPHHHHLSHRPQVALNPKNTVFDAKRLIGRRFTDASVQARGFHNYYFQRAAASPAS